jgi:serine/threonine-protein kinase
VPVALADVVERCLAKEPDDRFPDVATLAAALAPFGTEATRAVAASLGAPSVLAARVVVPRRAVSPSEPTVVDATVVEEPTALAPVARRRPGALALAGIAAVVVAAVGAVAVGLGRGATSTAAPAAPPASSVLAEPSSPPAPIEPPVSPSAAPSSTPASTPPRAAVPPRPSNARGRDPRSYR